MRLRVVAILLAALPMLLGGACNNAQTPAQDREPDKKKTHREEFAQDQAVDIPKPAPFDSARAMKYLKDLCALGPRISGSEGMRKQRQLLKEHFEKLGATVTLQEFEAHQRSQRNPIPMANMVITWRPDRDKRILLCSHYDTRPIADREPDRRNWTKPFLSANDGSAGVAWLMELAHHVKDLPLNYGLDFVLFDGEECIYEPGNDLYFFGSKHFANDYKRHSPKHQYLAGVLLDLCAGKGAKFPIEENSLFLAGGVVDSVWKTADMLGVKEFKSERGPAVDDDHIALNRDAGIPTVDLIDFSYSHWHRLSDLPENCSEETMATVAKVLTVWLQRLK